ncbi:hypothetical protein CAPTEDRAFT_211053 [Capitella teleta]|uniref:Endonuclease/exonuclease/phosphatase domain-containing protein n=1 Tax=Capitella teleta TaxID=283909 RepID=R7V7Z7_CAPTE|nr:hypothetical protein CAPTEDRAFT_211053 [Capitella teleta]|eukprot:ELU14617.1 hypothetical protein CAPTEDRAFT_211053 [Capitella teleta]
MGVQYEVNELLCFAAHHMQRIDECEITAAIIEYYPAECIAAAKKVLWDCYVVDLPCFEKRISSRTRPSHHKEAEDIMKGLKCIDSKYPMGDWPTMFVALDLNELPRWKPGEANAAFHLERIIMLERKLRRAEYFVFRVDPELSVETVKQHITDGGVTVVEIERMSQDNAVTQSFRVLVNVDDPNKLYNEDFWGDGGFKRSKLYIKDILTMRQPDILCLQETWLINETAGLIAVDTDYLHVHKSGMDSRQEVIMGRPKGGTAILYRSDFGKKVSHVDVPSSRACAVVLTENSLRMMLLCVYMPCDNYSTSVVDPEFDDVLHCIDTIMYANPCHEYVVCGDFKVSFTRNNAHSRRLEEFLQWYGLSKCWDSPISNMSNTYQNFSLNQFSCIDHICLSNRVFSSIESCEVISDPTNPSNHSALAVKVCQQGVLKFTKEGQAAWGQSVQRRKWNVATLEQVREYKAALDRRLAPLMRKLDDETVSCLNLGCTSAAHDNAIESLCSEIVNACLDSGLECIPAKKPGWGGEVAGWNKFVQPAKDRSLFWHWIWCECGRPNIGALYEAMKRSRHQYHYAVRLVRKNEFATKKNSLAEKIKSGADFWRELQKINPCSKMTPQAIGDADSPQEIADMFGKKYSELYTSVPTDANEMA